MQCYQRFIIASWGGNLLEKEYESFRPVPRSIQPGEGYLASSNHNHSHGRRRF